MIKIVLEIEQKVPTKIFETPNIKKKVDLLFSLTEDSIKERFDEIKRFIIMRREDSGYDQIEYEDILFLFKMYFYKTVLNKAVKIIFTECNSYNVEEIILDILSEENLKDAILGEPMISAFIRAIQNLPSGDSALEACLRGSMMFALEEKFLNRSYKFD